MEQLSAEIGGLVVPRGPLDGPLWHLNQFLAGDTAGTG
jgi:hypothetical protein